VQPCSRLARMARRHTVPPERVRAGAGARHGGRAFRVLDSRTLQVRAGRESKSRGASTTSVERPARLLSRASLVHVRCTTVRTCTRTYVRTRVRIPLRHVREAIEQLGALPGARRRACVRPWRTGRRARPPPTLPCTLFNTCWRLRRRVRLTYSTTPR